MTEDSHIELRKGSTTFVGPDATKLFATKMIQSAIDLYLKTGIKVNRAYTPTAMLAAASRTTGKTYPRGKLGLEQASADLGLWIEAMKSALPIERKD